MGETRVVVGGHGLREEVAGGLSGTIPLPAAGLGIQVGFDARAMVFYRALNPYSVSSKLPTALKDAERVARDVVKASLPLPLKPGSAARLPPGAEFEIVGRGTLNVSAGLSNVQLPSMALGGAGGASATIGMNANAGVSAGVSGEYGVTITGVDGKRLVRMTVARLVSSDLSARISTQLGFFLNLSTPDGALSRALTGDSGSPVVADLAWSFTEFVRDHMGASAYFEASLRAQDEVVDSFILDLDTKPGREAFTAVLRLSPAHARALAEQPDSGVTTAKLHTGSLAFANEASVRAFGQQVLLRQVLSRDTNARYEGVGGSWGLRRDATYQKTFSWLTTGKKEVTWEHVTLSTSKAEPLRFFHLKYDWKNKAPKTAQVERFTAFASALDASPTKNERGVAVIPWWKRVFTSQDDAALTADIYFTPEGATRIDDATHEQGRFAHLEAQACFVPALKRHPLMQPMLDREAIEMLQHFKRIHRYTRFVEGCFPGAGGIEDDYAERTGRSLRVDGHAYLQAESFGEVVAGLRFTDGSGDKFFQALGRANGFQFHEVMVALSRLAGDAGTLVHALSLQGRNVAFQARDEGVLESISLDGAVRSLMPAGVEPENAPTLATPVRIVPTTPPARRAARARRADRAGAADRCCVTSSRSISVAPTATLIDAHVVDEHLRRPRLRGDGSS